MITLATQANQQLGLECPPPAMRVRCREGCCLASLEVLPDMLVGNFVMVYHLTRLHERT
jgi:hypothetical protein